jgi:hypothetical protein
LGFYSVANEDYTFALNTERRLFSPGRKSGSMRERKGEGDRGEEGEKKKEGG